MQTKVVRDWNAEVGLGDLSWLRGLFPHGHTALLLAFGDPLFRVLACILAFPIPWMWNRGEDGYPSFQRGLFQSWLTALLLTFLSLVYVAWAHLPAGRSLAWVLWNYGSGCLMQISIFIILGHFMVTQDKSLQAQVAAEQKAREAQWVHLKGQLRPEVFFEAMDTLERLVQEGSPYAEKAVVDLTDLFRLLMEHGSKPITFLEEEKRLVEHYLSVERLRLGDRLDPEWDWDPVLDTVYAPPFLMQPVVEEALSRVAPGQPIRLCISGKVEHRAAVLRIAHGGDPTDTQESLALKLRSKLFLAFEDDASCRFFQDGEWSVVESTIPILPEIR